EAIAAVVAPHSASIADAQAIGALGRRIEEDSRVLAVTGATVVIAIGEFKDRHAIGGKQSSRWMDLDLVHGHALAVELRRGIEETQPLAARLVELAVIVGVLRKLVDAHEFAVDV